MRKLAMAVIGFGLFGMGAGVGAATAGSDASPTVVTPEVVVTSEAPAPKASKSISVIKGNDVVHVGEDVPAGTYRAVESVDGGMGCYWSKTRDSEGSDIIDNSIVNGGRPQVALKKGQWFHSTNCSDWKKK